jgi:hypothetical protein
LPRQEEQTNTSVTVNSLSRLVDDFTLSQTLNIFMHNRPVRHTHEGNNRVTEIGTTEQSKVSGKTVLLGASGCGTEYH